MNNEAASAILAKANLLHLGCAGAAFLTPQPTWSLNTPVILSLGNGWIIWSLACGAHYVGSLIYAHWLRLAGAAGFLGFPLTDELATRKGNGRFCDFQGGSIYWSPASGAAALRGTIRDYWASLGGVASELGFPLGEEDAGRGGLTVVQPFVGGMIVWSKKEATMDHIIVKQ